MNNTEIEKRERFNISQRPNIDPYLNKLYERIQFNANLDDESNIKEMNEEEKNIFCDIVKDCYNNLIKMQEIELVNDEFVIKIYDSETRVIASKINLSSSELLKYIVMTLFLYIYKLQRNYIRLGEVILIKNDAPYKLNYDYFTKIYTLILRIPGMSERIINLSNSIDSNEKGGAKKRNSRKKYLHKKRKSRFSLHKKKYSGKKRVKISRKNRRRWTI